MNCLRLGERDAQKRVETALEEVIQEEKKQRNMERLIEFTFPSFVRMEKMN